MGSGPRRALGSGPLGVGPGGGAAVPATTQGWVDPETARYTAMGLQATQTSDGGGPAPAAHLSSSGTERYVDVTVSPRRSDPGGEVIDTDVVMVDGHEIYVPRDEVAPALESSRPLALSAPVDWGMA
jgi:hypothetical protein